MGEAPVAERSPPGLGLRFALARFADNLKKGGSHIFVRDERLQGVAEFGLLGDFQIAVKGGQRVRKPYLKRLAMAVEIIVALERD